MKVLGLDPSTKLGLVMLEDDNVLSSKVINFPDLKGYPRLHLIATGVLNLVEEQQPDLIVIEAYAFGNKFTLVTMVEIGAILRYSLFRMSRKWLEVPPTVLKQFTTGKGNAKKEDMAKAVKTRWGFESKSTDIVDAYALAKMGQHVFSVGNFDNLKGVHYG